MQNDLRIKEEKEMASKMTFADRDKAMGILADMNDLIGYLHEEALSRLNKRVASTNDPERVHELLKKKLSLEAAYREAHVAGEHCDDDELKWALKGIDVLFSGKSRTWRQTDKMAFVKLCDEIIKNA